MKLSQLIAKILSPLRTSKASNRGKDTYTQAVQVGRAQFKKLVDQGLSVPVALL